MMFLWRNKKTVKLSQLISKENTYCFCVAAEKENGRMIRRASIKIPQLFI